MFVSLLFLIVTGTFTYDLFVLASIVGLLGAYEMTTPRHVRPPWQQRLRSIIVIGLVMFGYVSARRVLSLLPPQLF